VVDPASPVDFVSHASSYANFSRSVYKAGIGDCYFVFGSLRLYSVCSLVWIANLSWPIACVRKNVRAKQPVLTVLYISTPARSVLANHRMPKYFGRSQCVWSLYSLFLWYAACRWLL